MEDLPAAVAHIKATLTTLFGKDETWTGVKHLVSFSIFIPPHASGKGTSLGVDTTKLFAELPPAAQYAHGTKMIAMQPARNGRYPGGVDKKRATRQQDVVVTAVANLTEKRWRADVGQDKVIILSLNQAPIRVHERQKEQILADLSVLLKLASTTPELKFT
jgi:hypothetical protein